MIEKRAGHSGIHCDLSKVVNRFIRMTSSKDHNIFINIALWTVHDNALLIERYLPKMYVNQ